MIRQSTITAACSATMHPIYSLDNTINSFFGSQSTVTRRQCDELAVSLIGELSILRLSRVRSAIL